jgi:hypothetical protein
MPVIRSVERIDMPSVRALEAALGKLVDFQTHYKRTPARPENVGEAWEIKTKAYADRIAAALRYK